METSERVHKAPRRTETCWIRRVHAPMYRFNPELITFMTTWSGCGSLRGFCLEKPEILHGRSKKPLHVPPGPAAQLSPDARRRWKNLGRPYRDTHTRTHTNPRTLTHFQKYNPIRTGLPGRSHARVLPPRDQSRPVHHSGLILSRYWNLYGES